MCFGGETELRYPKQGVVPCLMPVDKQIDRVAGEALPADLLWCIEVCAAPVADPDDLVAQQHWREANQLCRDAKAEEHAGGEQADHQTGREQETSTPPQWYDSGLAATHVRHDRITSLKSCQLRKPIGCAYSNPI